jgi:hypothetical protein
MKPIRVQRSDNSGKFGNEILTVTSRWSRSLARQEKIVAKLTYRRIEAYQSPEHIGLGTGVPIKSKPSFDSMNFCVWEFCSIISGIRYYRLETQIRLTDFAMCNLGAITSKKKHDSIEATLLHCRVHVGFRGYKIIKITWSRGYKISELLVMTCSQTTFHSGRDASGFV